MRSDSYRAQISREERFWDDVLAVTLLLVPSPISVTHNDDRKNRIR